MHLKVWGGPGGSEGSEKHIWKIFYQGDPEIRTRKVSVNSEEKLTKNPSSTLLFCGTREGNSKIRVALLQRYYWEIFHPIAKIES